MTHLDDPASRRKYPIGKRTWQNIGPGVSLGYRRGYSGAGSWLYRLSDGEGSNTVKSFGVADDLAEANGRDVFDFYQAAERAREIARRRRDRATLAPTTVGEALAAYELILAENRRERSNMTRLRVHMPAALVKKPLAALKPSDFRTWRDAMNRQALAAGTINRNMAMARAALNYAADQDPGIGINRDAWRIGLRGLSGAAVANNVILRDDDVRAIVEIAREEGPEIGLFLEVAAVTGARCSQIARLQVRDLHNGNAPRLSMPVSKKGRGQKPVTHQPVPVPADLANRLAVASAGRKSGDLLLTEPDGRPWDWGRRHYRLFARIVRRVGLGPEVTVYALRHSSIARRILANVPLRIIAATCDTSVTMIERNYSQLIAHHADEIARQGMLDTAPKAGDRVVPIRR